MRTGAVFTGLVLLVAVGFWAVEQQGASLANFIPDEQRAVRSLFDRGGAILAIGVAIAIIASRERLGSRKLSEAYDSLKAEMNECERLHDHMIHTERLASMGRLSAAVAHEINNPMTYVIGNLQALQEELPLEDEEMVELIDDALDGATRVSELVKDMQLYSRTPEQRSLEEVDVAAALDTAAKMVANRVRYSASFRIESEEGLVACASESKLVQVIVNLLTNASDAMSGPADENELSLVAKRCPQGVLIEVRDTGSGISEEVQKRLFEPFYTTKDVGEGTGMGLAISRSLVESMKGSIDFESVAGEGTTFSIVLPASESPSSRPVAEPDRGLRLSRADEAGPLRILVIDDDTAVLRSIRRMLGTHEVETEADARVALTRCEKEEFDVVLCDIMMASMSGDRFYRALQQAQPAQAQRVTFMTGGVLTQATEDFLNTVDRPVLGKPLDIDEIRDLFEPESGTS